MCLGGFTCAGTTVEQSTLPSSPRTFLRWLPPTPIGKLQPLAACYEGQIARDGAIPRLATLACWFRPWLLATSTTSPFICRRHWHERHRAGLSEARRARDALKARGRWPLPVWKQLGSFSITRATGQSAVATCANYRLTDLGISCSVSPIRLTMTAYGCFPVLFAARRTDHS